MAAAMNEHKDDILTVQEAAQALRLSVDFIYDEIKAGRLKAQPVGRHYRIAVWAMHEAFPNLYRKPGQN